MTNKIQLVTCPPSETPSPTAPKIEVLELPCYHWQETENNIVSIFLKLTMQEVVIINS